MELGFVTCSGDDIIFMNEWCQGELSAPVPPSAGSEPASSFNFAWLER